MNLSQKIRNISFWIKDYFNKNVIKNNLDDITDLIENYSSQRSKARRDKLLSELLHHATTTTSYYKYLSNFDSLNDFPVVNKNIIRNNFQSFKSASFDDDKLYKVMTSGSTGIRFVVLQNRNKKIRNTADTIYFARKGNFKIGNQLIFMRMWDAQFRKPYWLSKLQNVKMVNVIDLSDEYFEELIQDLQRYKSEKGLYGYVSAFTQLCKYLDKVNSLPLNCNVTSIITGAEALTDYCKFSLEKYFGVQALSRYSNTENGILAQQILGDSNMHHINWASYFIEILDEERDEPVKNGNLGRIVVTDLFNYGMPIIRYDTGDLGVMDIDESGVPALAEVHGRKMDIIYDTRGNNINPLIVCELLFFENVKQFQLIQNGEKLYKIKLSLEGQFKACQEIKEKYRKYFGEDAIIEIEESDDIPILASGKRKLVVNNYHPKLKNGQNRNGDSIIPENPKID